MPRLTTEQRWERLDAQLCRLLTRHSLQEVVESLRRIATRQVEQLALAPSGRHSLARHNWGLALNILIRADQALYGQHCGDVHPVKSLED